MEEHPDLKKAFKPNVETMYLYGFPLSLREYQRNHVCRRHSSARIESENLAGLNFKVEHRYPYTDIRLLQYVLALPVEQKINKEQSRLIYRRSMKSYMPPSILAQDNKQGSLKPMNAFYRDNTIRTLIELYQDLMNQGSLPFINREKVDALIEDGYLPSRIRFYLRLGELGRLGKMDF